MMKHWLTFLFGKFRTNAKAETEREGDRMTFGEFKCTADEEELNCMSCENVHQGEEDENGDDYCHARCGPAHFWSGYMRWEEVKNDI